MKKSTSSSGFSKELIKINDWINANYSTITIHDIRREYDELAKEYDIKNFGRIIMAEEINLRNLQNKNN